MEFHDIKESNNSSFGQLRKELITQGHDTVNANMEHSTMINELQKQMQDVEEKILKIVLSFSFFCSHFPKKIKWF